MYTDALIYQLNTNNESGLPPSILLPVSLQNFTVGGRDKKSL